MNLNGLYIRIRCSWFPRCDSILAPRRKCQRPSCYLTATSVICERHAAGKGQVGDEEADEASRIEGNMEHWVFLTNSEGVIPKCALNWRQKWETCLKPRS